MSRVFLRAGRSGLYLGVSFPNSIRKKLGRNEVHKKVGNTHKGALINKSRVEAEIQRSFGAELNKLSCNFLNTISKNRTLTKNQDLKTM